MTTYRLLTLAASLLAFSSVAIMACGDIEGGNQCDPTTDTGCVCANDDNTVVESCDDDAADSTCTCELADTSNGTASNGVTANTITITNATFTPAAITVTVGTVVTWTNGDTVQRAIVCKTSAGADEFDQTLNANASITHTFNTAGVYTCRDRINSGPGLMGTVTVQ